MSGRHDRTTAVCVSLRWSGGLRAVQLPDGSWQGLWSIWHSTSLSKTGPQSEATNIVIGGILLSLGKTLGLKQNIWCVNSHARIAFSCSNLHDWCPPSSYPSSCVLVNHRPSQQSSKEEYKSWKWGTIASYYASHTKTILPTRTSVPISSRQLDHTKTSWWS